MYFVEQKKLHKEEQQRQQQYHKQNPSTNTSASKPSISTTTSPAPNNKNTTTVGAAKRRRMAVKSDSESDVEANSSPNDATTNIKTESSSTSSSSNTLSNINNNTSTNGNSSSTETMDICSENPDNEPKSSLFESVDLLNPVDSHNPTIKSEPTTTLPDTSVNTRTVADLTKELLTTLFEQTILSPKEEAELTEYKRRVDIRDAQLAALDLLSLPGNPLDVIIDSVGGPGKVAEMTGRKSRLVRDDSTGKYLLLLILYRCSLCGCL